METDSTFNDVWCPKSCKLLHGHLHVHFNSVRRPLSKYNSLVQSRDQVVENVPRLRSDGSKEDDLIMSLYDL